MILKKKKKKDVKLHFLPKFHCELNPIEMYWANFKWYSKLNNTQSNNEEVVLNLIFKARNFYKSKDTNFKIFGRFWRVVTGYSEGEDYKTVMDKYFKAKDTIRRHRIIQKKIKEN